MSLSSATRIRLDINNDSPRTRKGLLSSSVRWATSLSRQSVLVRRGHHRCLIAYRDEKSSLIRSTLHKVLGETPRGAIGIDFCELSATLSDRAWRVRHDGPACLTAFQSRTIARLPGKSFVSTSPTFSRHRWKGGRRNSRQAIGRCPFPGRHPRKRK